MSPKKIPLHLGTKLRAIRELMGWSLDQMADNLGLSGISRRTRVYEWESGIRQPDLETLLHYARIIEISTDVLIDDNQNLYLKSKK